MSTPRPATIWTNKNSKSTITPLLFVLLLAAPVVAQQKGAPAKTVPVGVKVESEGGGNSQGMWAQSARDLSAVETTNLQKLVIAEFQKQDDIKIVPLTYKNDFIGVVVVAARLPHSGSNWYIASSVITVSKENGKDEFLTHDVFAAPTPLALARLIVYQFATARLNAVLGLEK